MANDPGGQERTEAATPRRRQLARAEGNVPRSAEVVSVVSLAVSLAALAGFGGRFAEGLAGLLREHLAGMAQVKLNFATVGGMAGSVLGAVATMVLPFTLVIAVAGLGASVAQNGFLLSAKPLAPQFSRISPAAGVKRLFSQRALVELVKSLIKITVVGGVVGWTLMHTARSFVPLVAAPPAAAYAFMLKAMLQVAAAATGALALLALLDFFFQRSPSWDERFNLYPVYRTAESL